jgi:hypothetical protein
MITTVHFLPWFKYNSDTATGEESRQSQAKSDNQDPTSHFISAIRRDSAVNLRLTGDEYLILPAHLRRLVYDLIRFDKVLTKF